MQYHFAVLRLVTSSRTVKVTVLHILTAVACLFFIEFAAARAVLVPLTYDEATTYLKFIRVDFLSIFNFEVATNHILNTLLTKVSYVVGGNSELVLRMPNLIGYGMYMWFSLLILKQLRHRVIAFAGFMLLNLNLFVLDYFSLTRGYGMSLGFLMGALFFLFRFLTQLPGSATVSRDLSRAFLFAGTAVMANFSLLDAYLGVFGVALVALVVSNSTSPAPPAWQSDYGRGRRRPFPWLPLVAVVFTFLVLSQDIQLSEELYEPVEVHLAGLNDAEFNTVRVSRLDRRGRAIRLARDKGANVWRLGRPTHVAGLRIQLPVADAGKLEQIEVIVGKRPFENDQRHDGGWTSRDIGTTRLIESGPSLSLAKPRTPAYRPIINWAGDARYLSYLTGYTAVALSLLGALAALLKGMGWLAIRKGLLTRDQWRPLAASVLWLVVLAGTPLYLLQKGSQLYHGGTQGLIQDTFYSVISDSFYDKTYLPAQTTIVFDGVLTTLAAFGVVLYLSYRRRKLANVLPGVCLLAIMVIASLASVAERFLFQTPYLLDRTALFYIPLYVLFVTFLFDTIAELGWAGKALATSVVALACSASIYHFATTANVSFTLDWRKDSGTKAMMEDLGQVVAAEWPAGRHVVLGVDWVYGEVAAFYASKNTQADIDSVVLPWPSDFVYVEDGHQGKGMNVIRRYPVSNSLLARVSTTPTENGRKH